MTRLFLTIQRRLQKQAERFPFGIDLIAVAPCFDGTSQRRCHQELDALGYRFIAHNAEHKLFAEPKQGA
jgi:hypothetical protein